MSYTLKILRDYPLGFWALDETSGSSAADISGAGNNGTYVGAPATNILPLIPGGISGTKITNTASIIIPITKNYYGATTLAGAGTKYTSDNDFTIEVWISPSITTTNQTVIFADYANNIGLYYENGDIVFKVSATEIARYALYYSKKSLHIVGVYGISGISLYIDGILSDSKILASDFKFTNSLLSLSIGPTSDIADSFIVDAPAIYRYGLSAAIIRKHYFDGSLYINAAQIAYPENGTLFSCNDANTRAQFEYSYPVNKSWAELTDSNTYYDSDKRHIAFYKTETAEPKESIINDFFLIPTEIGLISSKVEWRNDLGITVESSVDEVTYVACTNGQAVPQYSKDEFDGTGKLYIRITMITSDASKYLPKLSFFQISFYTNKDLYADNYGDRLYSTSEYDLGSLNYSPLSMNATNGIRAKSGYGFNIDTISSIKSVEILFTPSTTGANTLFYAALSGSYAETKYAWDGTGVVSMTNVAKIYVNGVDKTSQTNISNFLTAGELHHIVIVFTAPCSTALQFNYLTSGGPDNLYNNIVIYSSDLTQAISSEHYGLYIGRPSLIIAEPSVSLTESALNYYDNDWIVIQSV